LKGSTKIFINILAPSSTNRRSNKVSQSKIEPAKNYFRSLTSGASVNYTPVAGLKRGEGKYIFFVNCPDLTLNRTKQTPNKRWAKNTQLHRDGGK
jgi:hypothetical protein